MSKWFRSGEEIDAIAIPDRGLQYGDGLFETIAIREGTPRLWTYHVERLQLGCERLGLPAPNPAQLETDLTEALRATRRSAGNAVAKIIVTAAAGPRGYRRGNEVSPSILIGVFDSRPVPATAYLNGIEARLCTTRLAEQPLLAGVKSLSRLEQVLARAEWQDAQTLEGLMLDTTGRLVCGTMSNVFIAAKNSLSTPALTRCGVAGVMRRHVMTVLADSGMDCEVRDIDSAELWSATEVFLTNSQFGILPVHRVDRQVWPKGETTARIMSLVANSGISECRT